jgi:hypothetical protein
LVIWARGIKAPIPTDEFATFYGLSIVNRNKPVCGRNPDWEYPAQGETLNSNERKAAFRRLLNPVMCAAQAKRGKGFDLRR